MTKQDKPVNPALMELFALRDQMEAKQTSLPNGGFGTKRTKAANPTPRGKVHHVGPCVVIGPNGTRVLKGDEVIHMVVPARKGGTRAYRDARAEGRTIRSSGRKPLNPAAWLYPPTKG